MNIDGLKVAKLFATWHHGEQRYSGIPYTHHLAAVEAVARRFKDDILILGEDDFTQDREDAYDVLLVATWLHDIVEDPPVKPKEIVELFGQKVADLVVAVTDEKGYPNRKTRKLATYPKTRAAGRFAVALKLCDRIANIEQGGLSDMYRKEHEDFKRALYTPGVNEAMWAHLDKLLAPPAEVRS